MLRSTADLKNPGYSMSHDQYALVIYIRKILWRPLNSLLQFAIFNISGFCDVREVVDYYANYTELGMLQVIGPIVEKMGGDFSWLRSHCLAIGMTILTLARKAGQAVFDLHASEATARISSRIENLNGRNAKDRNAQNRPL